jgi:hypothetical protein
MPASHRVRRVTAGLDIVVARRAPVVGVAVGQVNWSPLPGK